MSELRLPELKERHDLGGKLVHRTVSITLLGILLLAALGVMTLILVEVDITVEAAGMLEPLEVWRVHSATAGVIQEVRVSPGEEVRPGQLLARLDGFRLETELESLRLEARHKRTQSGVSSTEIELLEQSIQSLEERLERLTLTAPAAGVVLSADLDKLPGSRVDEGQLLFEVGSAGQWKAMLKVAEREIDPVRIDDPVKLRVPALSELESGMPERLPAKVSFVGTELAAESTAGRGLYRVDARLDLGKLDPKHRPRFRRGMSVEARIITRSARAIDLVTGYLKRQLGLND